MDLELGTACGRGQMHPVGPLHVSIWLADVGLIVVKVDVIGQARLEGYDRV